MVTKRPGYSKSIDMVKNIARECSTLFSGSVGSVSVALRRGSTHCKITSYYQHGECRGDSTEKFAFLVGNSREGVHFQLLKYEDRIL